MVPWLGYRPASSTVYIPFNSFAAATGASSATSNFASSDILIYKNGGTTQRTSANGITANTSFDSQTGLNSVVIDLSDNTDAGFYAAGNHYDVGIADVTIDGQTVRAWIGSFDIGPVQANATQLAGTTLTGRDIGASVLLSSGTGAGQLDFTSGVVKANLAQILGTALTETAGLIAAGFKKFFNVASPTGTVNSIPDAVAGAAGGLFIAGTNAATVVTTSFTSTFTGNLTGSAGSVAGAVGSVNGSVGSIAAGGISATSFSASAITAASIAADAITDAKVAADVTIASVTGAVGSVTGNVGGNVTGSVGSVATGGIVAASFAAGAVDAAALAADAGTEIGTAVWATATRQLTGTQTFNVTGNITGNVSGSVGSVTGAVGSVTGNVGGNMTGSVGSLAAQAKLDVNAEVDTALSDAGVTTTVTGRIDAAITTRASQTSVDTIDDFVDTEIAAIKAKTDLIPGTQDGFTFAEYVKLSGAVACGKVSGLPGSPVFRSMNDTSNRVTATTDADGNRSAVTLNP